MKNLGQSSCVHYAYLE